MENHLKSPVGHALAGHALFMDTSESQSTDRDADVIAFYHHLPDKHCLNAE